MSMETVVYRAARLPRLVLRKCWPMLNGSPALAKLTGCVLALSGACPNAALVIGPSSGKEGHAARVLHHQRGKTGRQGQERQLDRATHPHTDRHTDDSDADPEPCR